MFYDSNCFPKEYLIVGIDPGKTGAIACINSAGEVIYIANCPGAGSLPDRKEIANILSRFNNDYKIIAGIEQARPGKGAKSMFSYGINYGVWLMGLTMVNAKIHEVPVIEWKKEFRLRATKNTNRTVRKKLSILKARDLFPDIANLITNDGMAEALLIAEYIRRKYVFPPETSPVCV